MVLSGIIRYKKMDDKIKYIQNDNKQNNGIGI